ncbi:MAG: ABC transporter permease, partial [Candidatus Cloacimonetes bacterium]|nr:ABC transporter permease [Candidatus Cloacimonadota bacterium]
MAISLKESLVVGFTDFWSRKIRSFVTIIGIVLGTMSIIVVLSLVNGINKKSLEWMMERGGLARITVQRNWEFTEDTSEKRYFTLKEFYLIRSLLPEALYFSAEVREWFQAAFQDKKYWTGVYGVLPDFSDVEEWDVESGRFLNEFDLREANDVICIGSQVKEELFGNKNPLGEYITVSNRRLQVIGVMEHRFLKGNSTFGNENALAYLNRRAYTPISTMIHKITSNDVINSISLKARTVEEAPELRQHLEAVILNLRNGQPVFSIESAQEEAVEMEKNAQRFQVIFFLISTISLLVGGIVIMNIMLASIQERTREIGIRITVGARRRDIFLQFMVQTVLVTTIGGIFGIILGLSLLDVVGKFLDFELVAGGYMILIAL